MDAMQTAQQQLVVPGAISSSSNSVEKEASAAEVLFDSVAKAHKAAEETVAESLANIQAIVGDVLSNVGSTPIAKPEPETPQQTPKK